MEKTHKPSDSRFLSLICALKSLPKISVFSLMTRFNEPLEWWRAWEIRFCGREDVDVHLKSETDCMPSSLFLCSSSELTEKCISSFLSLQLHFVPSYRFLYVQSETVSSRTYLNLIFYFSAALISSFSHLKDYVRLLIYLGRILLRPNVV
jgi:hypothetical protein